MRLYSKDRFASLDFLLMYMKLYEATFGMRLYLGVRLFLGEYSSVIRMIPMSQALPDMRIGDILTSLTTFVCMSAIEIPYLQYACQVMLGSSVSLLFDSNMLTNRIGLLWLSNTIFEIA